MINKIGFYQLDNLIQNRVPFMFYNMSESIADWYSSVSRLHVNSYQVLVCAENILSDLTAKKVPKDYAIVLLCEDGNASLRLLAQLSQQSYTNVYVVDGGYRQLVTERSTF